MAQTTRQESARANGGSWQNASQHRTGDAVNDAHALRQRGIALELMEAFIGTWKI